MSICQNLTKHLGGKWTYHAPATWSCDDGKRMVVKCSPGVDQFDDPIPGAHWYLYGDGQPRRAEPYIGKHYLPTLFGAIR